MKWVCWSFTVLDNVDPNMLMVEMFFEWFGIDIQYLYSMNKRPKKLLGAKNGIYFVGLKIGLQVVGNHFDNHNLVYNANLKQLYDNNQFIQIPQIKESDLVNN